MIKINMGCGWRNFGEDWVHIDGGDYAHLDRNAGTIGDLVYKNGVVDLIYASHLLQYFDVNEADHMLFEWYRVLKPGGTIRLAVPSFYNMCFLYGSGDIELHEIIGPLYGSMHMGLKPISHKMVYDYKSLSYLLENIGFKDIKTYNWRDTCHAAHDDHSQAYIPHMEKDTGTLISLNVEATK